jgi:hypothetical protein
VVVDVPHHDKIATVVGQLGLVRSRLDDDEVARAGGVRASAYRVAVPGRQFRRVHLPCRPDEMGERHAEASGSGTDLRDGLASPDARQLGQALDLGTLVPRQERAEFPIDKTATSQKADGTNQTRDLQNRHVCRSCALRRTQASARCEPAMKKT